MRSTLLVLTLALAGAGLGLWAGGVWDRRDAAQGTDVARIGELAPDLALPDLDGRVRRLSDWAGRSRLINFWASWCGPCIEEMPLLDRYAVDQGVNGTQVLGIALDEPDAIRAFLARVPVRYPTLIEPEGRTDSSVKLGNRRAVLPFSALIDSDGRILRLRAGAFRDADDLATWADAD